jgi:hypothetical protein
VAIEEAVKKVDNLEDKEKTIIKTIVVVFNIITAIINIIK